MCPWKSVAWQPGIGVRRERKPSSRPVVVSPKNRSVKWNALMSDHFCAGIAIAFHARDRFGSLLATGLVGFIVFQAALNIGVTTAVLPNTGLPLPFVSYGGSALLSAMAAVGILLNIYRQGRQEDFEERFWNKGRRITPRV